MKNITVLNGGTVCGIRLKMSVSKCRLTANNSIGHFIAAPDTVLFDANLVASYSEMLDARCDGDCDLNCMAAVPVTGRRAAYDKFRSVAAVADARVVQNLYLVRSCVELKHRTVDTDIIEQTTEFWLGDEIKIKVCKTFFARTLGLPDARLNALLEPETFEWFSRYCKPDDDDDSEDPRSPTTRFDTEQPCSEFVLNSR